MFNLKPPPDDGLLIPTVGEWSRDKHYYLKRYIDAFTTSMKGDKWESLHYIDLFAGAGIERLENSNELDWGSPMIAAQAPFTKLHLCELQKDKYDSLNKRINKTRPDSQILNGDANQKIHDIIKEIPTGSLSLVFLDPYGLHLDFHTLVTISDRRTDLIIFFPDYLDVIRNWVKYYYENRDSNLDRFLGQGPDWRSVLTNTPPHKQAQALHELYVNQIKKLGYSEFEYERISAQGRPLYRLIFCSRHPLATNLWHKITLKKSDGQKTFDFQEPD